MSKIFINLKRFDVPHSLGGVCPLNKPDLWIKWVLNQCINYGIGKLKGSEVVFLLPENIIISAVEELERVSIEVRNSIKIGCQGVYRENISFGGNFGAFTTNRPAAAVKNMGCNWTIIGHSEERRDKFGIIAKFDPEVLLTKEKFAKATSTVNSIINDEIFSALKSDLKVLLCVGESAEEKGEGIFKEQKLRITEVLKVQLKESLKFLDSYVFDSKNTPQESIVIGYEPIWAIGPGKVPPGKEYIAFVSSYIKEIVKDMYNFEPLVVYGGGLKEENAGLLSQIDSIDGGLIALTRFSGDIGFYPDELKKIIEQYLGQEINN